MTLEEFGNLFTPIYLEAFNNLADLPPAKRPSHLAHYTSVAVLEQIVKNNEVWFSHPSTMNDHEEMWFGIREGIRIVQEASAGSPLTDLAGGPETFNQIVRNYIGFIQVFDTKIATDVYIFCLSKYDWKTQPDGLLSMWRGYGANGNGVALVFNTRFVTTQEGSPLLIAKVRYGSRQERADRLMESFTKCLTILRARGTNTNPQHIWHTAMNMFRLTLYQSLSSKHPGFAEEDEWRIVYLSDLDRHNLFKDRRHYYIRGNRIEPRLKFPSSRWNWTPGRIGLSIAFWIA